MSSDLGVVPTHGEWASNFMPGDEGERVQSAYGENYARLMEIKRRYDPKNLFRLYHNIVP
jgi:FAD/FMN-containing dehydrogenase